MVCGPRKAVGIAGAISVVEPERFVRWSLVGPDWQTVRARLKRLRYDIRQEFPTWQDCYHVERNPRRPDLFHAHSFQHGPYVAQARLQRLCERRGLGYPWIERWQPTSEQAYAYGLKVATGYGMKLAQRQETLREYLQWNGGRLVHASRGFWREGSTGLRLAGMEAARAVWIERHHGRQSAGTWRLELDDGTEVAA